LAGTLFWSFWEHIFEKIHGKPFFSQKGGLSFPKGVQSPFFWKGKGAPANFLIPKCTNQVFLQYLLVKYQESTNQYQPKIPNEVEGIMVLYESGGEIARASPSQALSLPSEWTSATKNC
jgi:hypothetical protein